MKTKQLVVVGIVLAVLVGTTGVVAADSHHRACPDDNPGRGLDKSTEASGGTSLENALEGIGRAVDAVGCDGTLVRGAR